LPYDLDHCGLDSLKNLEIARAPAQVARKRFSDLIAIGMGILIQQGFRRHQDCRRAISALCRSKIGKGILQWMKFAFFSEPFHGQYLPSVALERQHETRNHGLAIQKNRASSAFSQFTSMLRAGMTEILTEDLQQRLIRCEGDVNLFAVQRESYL